MANEGTVGTNVSDAQAISDRLTAALDSYVAFSVSAISGTAPCSGSSIHDGEIQKSISSSLSAWSALVRADAAAIASAAVELKNADIQSSQNF